MLYYLIFSFFLLVVTLFQNILNRKNIRTVFESICKLFLFGTYMYLNNLISLCF